jgi:hypothetical protein
LPQLPALFASLATPGNAYFDYHRHAMGSDNRYFYNYTHLNAEGAEQFSVMLSKDLTKFMAEARP